VSDPRLIASLGFISAISRSVLAIASLGLLDDDQEPQPAAPPPPVGGATSGRHEAVPTNLVMRLSILFYCRMAGLS